jgi:EpsI family protein
MGPRFWTVAVLLAGTAGVLGVRGDTELIPVSEPLPHMPHVIAGWSGADVLIDRQTLDVLGKGEFLSRVYKRPDQSHPMGLFIGYFPSQRTDVTIHSPKNCLPGDGWAFESSHYVYLIDASGKPHHVGEYVISNGDSRQFVIYWYQAHGRSIANEYMAKIFLVMDAMRLNRTDGALIRVATTINPNEGTALARTQAETFATQLVPLLTPFIPN